MAEKPALPWFIATQDGNIESAHCICMTSLGETCSHAAALMFYVQDLLMRKGEISVTSIAPYWGQPKKVVLFPEVGNMNYSSD